MADFVTPEWEARAAAYDAGLSGSRRLMEWEVTLIDTPPDRLRAIAAAQPHDAGFASLVRRARAARIPIEVVSDGFGFFIPSALEVLGVPDVPVVSARTTFGPDGRATIAFPNGHPRCFVCGTCKRNRVLSHKAAGRAVVFVGDGESDRYAAGYSDVVFAKRALITLCTENGWPFREWSRFADVEAWLAATIDAWRVDPTTLPVPQPRAIFCGPEVWGEGRRDPPAPAGRPDATTGSEGAVPG
jgi:2-hydroxy-3-keto-5-methylthiopentenyl-1-phosphate phosphatase